MTSLANGSQEILNPEIEKKQNNSVQAVIFSLLERLFLRAELTLNQHGMKTIKYQLLAATLYLLLLLFSTVAFDQKQHINSCKTIRGIPLIV